MENRTFANTYLSLLKDGDATKLAQLFSKEGMVSSPIYGLVPATDFFKKLFEDTNASKLTLDGIFQEKDPIGLLYSLITIGY